MLHPYVAVLVLDRPGDTRMELAGHLCTLLADLVLLCAAFVLALDARLTRVPIRASMATVVALVAVQDAPVVVLALLDPGLTTYTVRLTYGHLVVLLLVVGVLAAGLRSAVVPRAPLVTGWLLGLVALAVSLGVRLVGSPYLELHDVLEVLTILLVAGLLGIAYAQVRRAAIPAWAANRLGAGMLAIFVARLWSTAADADAPLLPAVAGVVLFSALIASTVTVLLRTSLADTQDRAVRFAQRAAEAEATVKHDREVAHELRAATAGIVAGAHLLANGKVPEGPRRRALERMVDAEAARVTRRLSASPGDLSPIDLDSIIEPLVVAQRALGHEVSWTSRGHRVVGRRDNLAEAVNVLLTNAARHARGAATTVVSKVVGDQVEIWVTDEGPGVDPEVRKHLFEWGARRKGSPGEGIGLQRAHRLVREQGGQLELRDRPGHRGTAFTITLPQGDHDVARQRTDLAG